MAQLKDLLVSGASRFIGNIVGNVTFNSPSITNVYSGTKVLAQGSSTGVGDSDTPVYLNNQGILSECNPVYKIGDMRTTLDLSLENDEHWARCDGRVLYPGEYDEDLLDDTKYLGSQDFIHDTGYPYLISSKPIASRVLVNPATGKEDYVRLLKILMNKRDMAVVCFKTEYENLSTGNTYLYNLRTGLLASGALSTDGPVNFYTNHYYDFDYDGTNYFKIVADSSSTGTINKYITSDLSASTVSWTLSESCSAAPYSSGNGYILGICSAGFYHIITVKHSGSYYQFLKIKDFTSGYTAIGSGYGNISYLPNIQSFLLQDSGTYHYAIISYNNNNDYPYTIGYNSSTHPLYWGSVVKYSTNYLLMFGRAYEGQVYVLAYSINDKKITAQGFITETWNNNTVISVKNGVYYIGNQLVIVGASEITFTNATPTSVDNQWLLCRFYTTNGNTNYNVYQNILDDNLNYLLSYGLERHYYVDYYVPYLNGSNIKLFFTPSIDGTPIGAAAALGGLPGANYSQITWIKVK